MNKLATIGVAFAALAFTTAAQAGVSCTVDDPTGTPLNVRAGPNGPILGALHNGMTVKLIDLMSSDGRSWAYVVPVEVGKRGWVFRRFLDCE
jgi:uncharacterized protein YraI